MFSHDSVLTVGDSVHLANQRPWQWIGPVRKINTEFPDLTTRVNELRGLGHASISDQHLSLAA
jgi:hypothetical protein